LVIQEQVDGLGNFHAPPPVFDGIMLMLIDRGYHNFLSKFDKFLSWQVMRTFARAGLADQTTDRSGGQSFLSRPAVVCACCLGFSSGSPLSGGAGLGSFSSIAVKYSGYDG